MDKVTDQCIHSLIDNVPKTSSTSTSLLEPDFGTQSTSLNHPKFIPIYLKKSLLIFVITRWLKRRLQSSLESDVGSPGRPFKHLIHDLPVFFQTVSQVSHRFSESIQQSTNVFFKTTTFPMVPEDLPQLTSIASLFQAAVSSVFLHVDDSFEVEDILGFSHLITGVEIRRDCDDDLDFLNSSSPYYFPQLKRVDASVDPSVILSLAEVLKVNSTISELNLVGCSIGVEVAVALFNALKVNSTVTLVNLGRNSIGREGAEALAEALKVNSSIQEINLAMNSIGPQGAMTLAKALKVNTSVREINLAANSIGVEGTRALADALKVNSTLKRFYLHKNLIGPHGAIALAKALKVNTSVTWIYLQANSIGAEGAAALADALKVNSTVTRILQ
ncbi:hypothetical protein GEMRC1_013093 [Eukaryota sp. GEM-RC1]